MRCQKYLLHDSEAADLARMNTRRFLRIAKEGQIPTVILPDGEYRFYRHEVIKWIERHHRPATKVDGHA